MAQIPIQMYGNNKIVYCKDGKFTNNGLFFYVGRRNNVETTRGNLIKGSGTLSFNSTYGGTANGDVRLNFYLNPISKINTLYIKCSSYSWQYYGTPSTYGTLTYDTYETVMGTVTANRGNVSPNVWHSYNQTVSFDKEFNVTPTYDINLLQVQSAGVPSTMSENMQIRNVVWNVTDIIGYW